MNAKQIKSFKDIRTKLLKVAQDELDLTKQIPNGESGPQEVVDAVAEIASDLEEVIQMIPAEPQGEEGVDVDDQEPTAEAQDDVSVDPVVDEEKELMQAKIATLEKKLDTQEKDAVANKIAELYGGSEDKYNEIMASDKDAKFHAAQLETLEDFVKNVKPERPQIAQDFSSYVKVAQQLGKKGDSKRKML